MDFLVYLLVGIWIFLGLMAWETRSGRGITLRMFIILGPLGFLLPSKH